MQQPNMLFYIKLATSNMNKTVINFYQQRQTPTILPYWLSLILYKIVFTVEVLIEAMTSILTRVMDSITSKYRTHWRNVMSMVGHQEITGSTPCWDTAVQPLARCSHYCASVTEQCNMVLA